MTRDEAVEYIENAGWSKTRLGLSRTRELLARLGDPQNDLRFIHVAGSNGKGSTCAMLDSILREAGYCSGLYTSPFLERFEEQIRADGREISGEELAELTEAVRAEAEKMEDHPSRFEMITAIAMLFFRRKHADPVILEVGMGGALDSTNAIGAPEIAVITNITLEHTEYLGTTLEEITETKCGIIKPGCSVICYDGEPEVTGVVSARCAELGVPLTVAGRDSVCSVSRGIGQQVFSRKGAEYSLSLAGEHQMYNAAVALEVIAELRRKGWNIPEEGVRRGLAAVKWPARFEVMAAEPLVILDGAHNLQCAQALAGTLEDLVSGRKAVFIIGILADKNYEKMTELLAPYAERFLCVTPPSPRAMSAELLAEYIRAQGAEAEAVESLQDAVRAGLREAADCGGVLVMTGSLYLAGKLRSIFGKVYRKWLRSRKIKARNSLSEEDRIEKSAAICCAVSGTDAWKKAHRILMYKWTRGEVKLDLLEKTGAEQGKELIYPLCISDTEMIAVLPGEDEGAWKSGYYGILEPDADKGTVIAPEDIELVICPCSSFDEDCNRMGMGGGFYDRYLPHCIHADYIAVAFETQKSAEVPVGRYDIPVDCVITETSCYNSNDR